VATKKVEEVKKEYKIRVRFDGSRTATIYYPGMPFVIDIVDNVLNKISSYKEDDIEVIGEKPANWETWFPAPIQETPVVEIVSEVIDNGVKVITLSEEAILVETMSPEDATAKATEILSTVA
jgi:hypothetical protein